MTAILAALLVAFPVADQIPPVQLHWWEEQAILAEMASRVEARMAADAAPPPAPPPAPPATAAPEDGIADVWLRLADCETGDRANGHPVPGTRRWHVGADAPHLTDQRPPWSSGLYYGGLQFDRWESWPWAVEVGGHDVPANPANATPRQQVEVAITLQRIHPAGWGAWPDCSRRLGLR